MPMTSITINYTATSVDDLEPGTSRLLLRMHWCTV